MANNNADIQLLATLDINSSEPDILRAIQILQKRIRNNDKAKLKLEIDIDRTTFNTAISKLQKIIKSKDLTIDTRKSIEALLNESNAMIDVVQSARKAANEKIEFANANKKVKQSADDTADAIRRERNAMESLDDIDYIMQNITRGGQQGNSVFQQFGTTLRDAFYAFTAANILQDAIYKVIDAGREGVEVVKELNDAATSLRMATGDSYNSVKSLLGSYNELGQELGAITTDVSESADEWLRQGHSIEDTNTLIKDSMILSKVSNLESAESTKYLTSAMQGYKVAVENVLGIVDKLSAVDLESATDAGGLAEAMSRTAEGANLAGISMDRLLGMIATVGEVTQKSMSSIGESYKTIFSRMRDIKDNKLSVIGEDGEIEDLSNVEIVLDSLGIKLRESNQEFRNFQVVLDEVAGNWDNYSSVQQAAIAKAFSGVRQQENFLVMMENWDKVLEYTDVASKSSGTAEEKFGFYLESLEAKTNSLKASLENLASTTISDELYGSVLDTSKAVVDLTADTGALKGLLVGLGTAGSVYAFQQLAHFLGDATQGFANLNEAMNMTNGTVGINDMQRLVDLTGGLSQSQTRLLLSTNNLTDAQKVAILMNQNMTQAEAEQTIQTWGVATAQNGATSATVTFTGALRGLWATLMANPLVLVTTLVTSGAIAFNLIQQAQEEARQKSQELTQAWKEENDTIDETISKYKELKESIESGTLSTEEITSAKEDLASIEDTLVEKYGTEALNIDLVNGKYEEQLATLKELSKEKARQFVAENGKSVKSDIEYLEDDFYSSTNLAISKAGATAEEAIGFDLSKILENYSNLSIDSHLNGMTSQRTFRLDANGTREETYNQLVGLYNDLKERYGSENKNVNSVLDKITSLLNSYYDKDEIDAAKERVKSYAEADILSQNDTRALYDDATKAVEEYNEALASGKGVEEAKANLETVQEKVDDAFGENGILGDIHGAEDVFNDLWSNVSEGATEAGEDVKQLFSSFEGSEIGERLQYLTQQFKDGELTYKEYFDALQSEIDNVDFSNYTDSLDEANKAAQQFFTDSIQQTATGLSDLISKFDEGSIGITEYLEGYVSIAETLSSLTDNLQENSASWDKNGEAIDNATSKALDETQSKLDSAINTIASYQDSIYSLEQIMTQSVEVGSDEFNAHAQVIAQDLYNIVQAGGLMADEVANTLGTTTSQIAKSLTENVSNQSLAAQAISANTNTAITNMATAVGELFDSLGEAISNFKVDVTFGVKSITTKTADLGLLGKVQLPAIKFGIEADGESLSAIGDAVSSFGKSVASNFTPQTIDINDYLFGNTETGKNSSYTPSGDILNNYNNALDKIKKSGKGTSQVFDWIENKLKSVQRTITNLGKTVSATWKSWTTRNNALAQQISEVNKEITLQQQAYQKYMALANGVGLSSYYQNLVKNGTIDISTITNEDLIDQIKAFENFYNKALDCQDAIVDLEDELVNLAETEFDNVVQQYDDELSLIEHRMNILDKSIDQLEVNGYLVSKKVYEALLGEEENKLLELQQKYISLQSELNSSGIARFTQKWFELNKEISSTKEAILESRLAIDEFEKTIMELDWEVFDKLQDMISSVTTESNFLIDLMSSGKLVDDKGAFTDIGKATIGLHVTNYETYRSQIEDYTKAIEELDKQFANDSLDQNYLARRRELIELVQDSVLSLEDEKQSIKSLWSDGYGKLLDYMQELIDKRLKLQNSASSLFDYQKNVKDQVEEISRLQNILNSYGNDNSEEAKMLIQKYQVELEDARETLSETEREQQLREEEKLLTSLMDSAAEWQNQRLDDITGLMQSAIDSTNSNGATISDTLKEVTGDVGYVLSEQMQSIWDGTGKNIVGDGITTVSTTLTDIKNLVAKMASDSNAVANSNVQNAQTSVTPSTTVTPTVSNTPTTSNSSSNDNVITVGSRINAGNALIYRQANGTKGYHQFYDENPYYVIIGQKGNFWKVRHQSLSSGTTGWFKKSDVKAYKTGGLVDYTGLAWVDGQKGKPEAFLNANDTELFAKLKDSLEIVSKTNMFDAIQNYAKMPNFTPNNVNKTTNYGDITVQFELPNVYNYEQFMSKMQRDPQFEGMVLEITDGSSNLGKYKYSWKERY